MKSFFIIVLFFVSISFAQKKQFKLDADRFIGVDNLEQIYYTKNNVLYKKMNSKTLTYANLHLGKIELVDITNPLKIVVFYKEFNSVIILDNELNEISNTIDFNRILFKNIAFVGTSSNANLWLFSKDDSNLLLYNYQTNKVLLTKQIDTTFDFITATSNYHNVWIVTGNRIVKYNTALSVIKEDNIVLVQKVHNYKNDIFIKSFKNSFHYLSLSSLELMPIKKGLIIKDFYVNNNLLYFFDLNYIYTQEFIKK